MASASFFLGIFLFLSWFTTDVHSEKLLFGLKGSRVVLSPGDVETSIISITWKHGVDLAAEWFGADQTFYRIFKDGCSLNTKTGELTINDVRPEHSGEYTPEINGRIRSALKLQVLSPVPKPRITHDCNPDQTKCTLTCSFDRTDDLGDVEVFWILDDRREKGTELQITKDTKEKTFICSLNNPVSSQNSTELKNPLFSAPVPKPRIIHDCDPEQTKCTLTCSFDRTDDLGDVEVFWILDDRREKGTEIHITKETKEETFICSLKNPVSSQNSTELKNPLLPRGTSLLYLLILLFLIVLIGVGVLLIFHHKKRDGI